MTICNNIQIRGNANKAHLLKIFLLVVGRKLRSINTLMSGLTPDTP